MDWRTSDEKVLQAFYPYNQKNVEFAWHSLKTWVSVSVAAGATRSLIIAKQQKQVRMTSRNEVNVKPRDDIEV